MYIYLFNGSCALRGVRDIFFDLVFTLTGGLSEDRYGIIGGDLIKRGIGLLRRRSRFLAIGVCVGL